jgi:GABA(A) receptor-associated protein
MISEFKKENDFTFRSLESERVLTKYPDRRPVICERLKNAKNTPQIDKKKYLIPNEFTIGQLIYVIRQRIKLHSNEAVFIFINGKMIPSSSVIGTIYDTEHDEDGFLYIFYSRENTFG